MESEELSFLRQSLKRSRCRESCSMKQADQECVHITIHALSDLYIFLSMWHKENVFEDQEVLCPELRNTLLLVCYFPFLWSLYFFKIQSHSITELSLFFFFSNHSKGFWLNASPLTWEFEFFNMIIIMAFLGVITINKLCSLSLKSSWPTEYGKTRDNC